MQNREAPDPGAFPRLSRPRHWREGAGRLSWQRWAERHGMAVLPAGHGPREERFPYPPTALRVACIVSKFLGKQ